MTKINLKQNFTRIIRTLEDQGSKPTNIAKTIGYTTTAQLNSALEGESLLSTKAIIGLIENLNVNPTYLFLGKGDMFLTDESEIDKLKKDNQELSDRLSESANMVVGLRDVIKELEKRNTDLIDMSAAAIKFHKLKSGDQPSNAGGDIEKYLQMMKLLKEHGWIKSDESEINLQEFESSLKRNKK